MFVVKQIVWAKVKNYPWWPAQINKLPNSEQNYFKVTFIGQTNHALLQEKAVRKYLEHYDHLKNNTYKGLQNSIDQANHELQKRKALIEESQNKSKNMKSSEKGKRIKKNNKCLKRKPKGRQNNIKNKKILKGNFENDCQQKQKVQIKNDLDIPVQNRALIQCVQQKSEIGSVNLSQDCEAQSAEINQIEFMRSVDRKKIEHTEQVLFSFIKRFNSNLFDNERDCFDAIQKLQSDEFKPQQLIQSKITNMITYIYKKLTERNSSSLKKQELQKINKIKTHLIQKAYNYLFDCSYYDQYIKRMEKNVSLTNIEKEQNKKSQPRLPTKKYRKYKRKQHNIKKIHYV